MSSVIPYLTIQDKENLSVLEPDTLPALIVEGTSDIKIYSRLLSRSSVDKQKYEIVVGKCKNEILKYHQRGLSFKYVAIIDADYDRYKNCCNDEEESIIYTHYYTLENYLVTDEVLEAYLQDIQTIYSPNFTATALLEKVRMAIAPFILACLCKLEQEWSIQLEGCSIERWWNFSKNCIEEKNIVQYLTSKINECSVIMTDDDCKRLLSGKRLVLKECNLRDINSFVCGKRQLEALFFTLKKYYPREMEGRNRGILLGDLCKRIFNSSEAIDLLGRINNKLNAIVA